MDIIRFAEQLNDQIEENRELRRRNSMLMEKVERYDKHLWEELQGWNKVYGDILAKVLDK